MDSLITISEETPTHLVSYWLGVLVGMGIPYRISPESPLFRTMQGNHERIREELRIARLNKNKPPFNKQGYRVIHAAGDSDSISVRIKRDG